MKVKRILISQPEPPEKSHYSDLEERYKVTVNFRPFTQVEGVSVKDFRKQRIEVLDYTAVIFTARTAIDNFFRVCEKIRVTIPETMKYFCTTEAIALYLQKYIVYRKRKIFFGDGSIASIISLIGTKHKSNNFLLALSDNHKDDLAQAFTKAKLKYSKVILYKIISSDLKDLDLNDFDMLAFYSPAEIKSLQENFPKFKQSGKIIITFGHATAHAAEEAKLKVNIQAPTPEIPSMRMAIESYLKTQK